MGRPSPQPSPRTRGEGWGEGLPATPLISLEYDCGNDASGTYGARPPRGRSFFGAADLALDPAAARRVLRQSARFLVAVDFSRFIYAVAVRGLHRQRSADRRSFRRRLVFPDIRELSRDGIWRGLPDRSRLSRPGSAKADRRQGMDGLAADPVQLQHDQLQSAEPRTVAAVTCQLARHRRPGPRRAGALDLRLSNIRAVRTDFDRSLVADRGRCRCRARLFRRFDRSRISALYRDLVGPAGPLPADHHGEFCRAQFLVAPRA